MSQTPPEALRKMGVEFDSAAGLIAQVLQSLELSRIERLDHLRDMIKRNQAHLAGIKEELRTLPEQIAKWEAERARLESQTGLVLLRAVVAEQEAPKPAPSEDPSVPGLPPLRLREVWAEWEDEDDPSRQIVIFKGDTYRWSFWHAKAPDNEIGERQFSGISLRPRGKTWKEVEAMADAAEKQGELEPPALLDLRTLKVGTVCEAMGEITWANEGRIQHGQRFVIATQEGFESQSEYPVLLERANERGDMTQGWCRAEQPARVVEVPR